MTTCLNTSSLEDIRQDTCFPVLDLPLLALEKIISLISDPFDLKALRCTCKAINGIINRKAESLIHLKVTPKDLKDLESIVKNESDIKWNNFRFLPHLNYVGCRSTYLETFNRLFSELIDKYAMYIQSLEMDKFDFSNGTHLSLLKQCRNLVSFKVEAMNVKGLNEEKICDILGNDQVETVLKGLSNLDVNVLEFLQHSCHFEFMGRLFQKCVNLRQVSSWGYFPEWEQASGGKIHLKYFVWPLLQYLRKRVSVLNAMLENIQSYEDLVDCDLEYFNERMDWQAGKWVIDLRSSCEGDDFSNLERFVYSRIKGYSHRAVGWFDETEFLRCGLPLMRNLSTIHIHNARDISLSDESTFTKPLFTKLESITLIAGNRLSFEQSLPLEKVVANVLLNTQRPSVTTLKLDCDLNHHHDFGSISLPLVMHNFPSLTWFCVEEWGPTDEQLEAVYDAFPLLEILMFCGRNISDVGILGSRGHRESETEQNSRGEVGIHKLSRLKIVKIFSVRLPPKNVFPWPVKENHQITNLSFQKGFSQLPLRKLHFLLKSDSITSEGIVSLTTGAFAKTGVEFLTNWLPGGFTSVRDFEGKHPTFQCVDPNTFLQPSNFVIPDIGKWAL